MTEVREITLSPWIFVRAVMTSSCIPLAKTSLSGWVLRFSNGNTAIDFDDEAAGAGVLIEVAAASCRCSGFDSAAFCWPAERSHCQAPKAIAIATAPPAKL